MNTSSSPSPFTAARDGVRVRLRVVPRASANRLAGLVGEADGGVALKVTVTAAPDEGKANAAIIALLARAWRLAKSDLTIVSGAADRRKTILVAGRPAQLLPHLATCIADLSARRSGAA